MDFPVYNTQEFYTREVDYTTQVDPTWWTEDWDASDQEEMDQLTTALGKADGRSILDCTCGWGNQAIALAKLGWQVTATDFTKAYLDLARGRAAHNHLQIRFLECDVRQLDEHFQAEFDWVLTCMALDNIPSDEGIRQAVRGMYAALKPGGKCYIRLRDMDNIMQEKPRYEYKGERILPYGRIVMLEDWIYESKTHVIDVSVFWLEDKRKSGYQWSQEISSVRRRALRKAELAGFLVEAGFKQIRFLPQVSPWHPYEVVASTT